MQGCKDLIEEYKRSTNRKGYKDIREEAWPDDEDEENHEEEGEEAEGGKRRRTEERRGIRRSREKFEDGMNEGEEEGDEGAGEEEYPPTEPISSLPDETAEEVQRIRSSEEEPKLKEKEDKKMQG